MRLYLDDSLIKAKVPSARASKPAAAASKVLDVGNKEGAAAPLPPTANQAPTSKKPSVPSARAPKSKAEGASSAKPKEEGEPSPADTTSASEKAPGDAVDKEQKAASKQQTVDCPLGEEKCRRNGGTGHHRQGSPLLTKHQALAAKGAGAQGTAASPDAEGPIPKEQEAPVTDNAVPGQTQQQHEPVMSPESQAIHQQSMQEYLGGSRDQEQHKMNHAMTVNEHRQEASKFRKNGNAPLAQLHEQAAVQKPRLKDISGANAYATTPPNERKYNSSYLDGYISQATRYLNGGPGGHPGEKYAEIQGMSEADHLSMADKLESSGAKSAANRHRRIGAMKASFSGKEQNMQSRREAETSAKAAAKAGSSATGGKKVADNDASPHGQVQNIGSNIMSHLVHNHDMTPDEKSELLKVAKHAKGLHDKGDASPEDVGKLKTMAGRYGDSEYSGPKTRPGKRYLSKFSNDELEDHAQFAEASGDPDLAQRYRSASASNTEKANLGAAKAQSKAAKEQDKQQATAGKESHKAANAEARRVAAAPDLPADHGEYKAHAKTQAGRLHDFLNGPAQIADEDRPTLENAHKVMQAHASLDSPATASQRRELRDATKIADKHMNNAEYKQLGDGKEEQKDKAKNMASTFNKWWSFGSQIGAATAKDQSSGQLAQVLPHKAAETAVNLTKESATKNSEPADEDTTHTTQGKHDDFAPKKRESSAQKKDNSVKKGLYLDLNKAQGAFGVDSPSDEKAATQEDDIERKRMEGVGGGDGGEPDTANKSVLLDISNLLKSMRNNLMSQLNVNANSEVESRFLIEKGFPASEARYNTDLLQKGYIRKEYDNWLQIKLEKSLSSFKG